MLLYEEQHGVRFDAVVMHDAEDLIHPESLRLINYFLEDHDMVQVPVLPLPTPPLEWTHGVYCDEFAEYQTKDIPVRQFLGGFLASNGVGTGFSRRVIEKLAERHSNRIFEPLSLTEDYETGFRIHLLRCPQLFVPVSVADSGPVATREYFPRNFREAVKQRTRWVTGISLQGWEYHGWHVPARQLYWLWRDRKGLLGNLLTPVLNLLFLYGAGGWAWGLAAGRPWGAGMLDTPALRWLCSFTLASAVLQLGVRTGCVWRIYGWRFAAGVPARAIWANVLNCVSTVVALWRYSRARLLGQPLVWLKTDHTYPSRGALMPHKRRLGDILVTERHLSRGELEHSLASLPAGERIGEYLVRTGKLTEDRLYQALSVQHSLPLGVPAAVSRRVTRSLPAGMARKWRILPFQVRSGKLFVAGPDLPSDEMADELQRASRLELRFQLVTPQQYRELASQYLQGL
jgi:adsorption protein B